MAWKVEASHGIHLPQIGWHLDAHKAVERAFVSHAHFDHLGRHRTVLCSPGTAALMAARMSVKREMITVPFGRPHPLDSETVCTLHPAGHVLGSAQIRVENAHGSLLYTGDFKLRPGLAAETCETPRADTLIMETTYGRPEYAFPPAEEVMARIVDFCRRAIDEGAVPVLFGYSLGRAQELLAGLRGTGLPVMLHEKAWRIARVYESLGISFPPYRKFDHGTVSGHVVIAPQQSPRSPWMRRIRAARTAAVSGWALDRGAIYRYRCDAVFPLSDHADFPDLIRFVERVQPRRVYTVHGFAVEFAQTLRRRGIEAWALGRENQLELPLVGDTP
ncbi:MAG: MBL fold metallo-hydrolase [Verrucomicrobia bacterium]|nr:MAG: MBL fold metallo-hydrolase [Verrucomicrobiota bacterium]